MKRVIIAALYFLVSLTAVSCSKMDDLFGNGEPVSEVRQPDGPFCIICMYDNVNVNLKHSSRPRFELTCPKNLIDNIVTEVRNDSLIIRNDNNFNWLRSYDYTINMDLYFDSLCEINYASTARLTTQDTLRGCFVSDTAEGKLCHSFMLRTKEGCGDIDLMFNCDVLRDRFFNGTSYITLRGIAGYTEHIVRSYGTVHAEGLNSNIVSVMHESTNDLYLWVRNGGTLQVYLNSIGNLYYKGHPDPTRTHIRYNSTGKAYPLE